jgi:hypothetical protein
MSARARSVNAVGTVCGCSVTPSALVFATATSLLVLVATRDEIARCQLRPSTKRTDYAIACTYWNPSDDLITGLDQAKGCPPFEQRERRVRVDASSWRNVIEGSARLDRSAWELPKP